MSLNLRGRKSGLLLRWRLLRWLLLPLLLWWRTWDVASRRPLPLLRSILDLALAECNYLLPELPLGGLLGSTLRLGMLFWRRDPCRLRRQRSSRNLGVRLNLRG